MAKTNLTLDLLKESLHYDPLTGIFTRLKTKQLSRWSGKPAGYKDELGYIRIRLTDGKIHKAHRLAWFYVYGNFPDKLIDHIDGNPSNNKIDNLRLANHSENRQNARHGSVSNSHGFLGVSKRSNNRYQAVITLNGLSEHLGTFLTPELAYDAYIKRKREIHPFCEI